MGGQGSLDPKTLSLGQPEGLPAMPPRGSPVGGPCWGTPGWSDVRILAAARRPGVHPLLSDLPSPPPGGAWALLTAPEAAALPQHHQCNCCEGKPARSCQVVYTVAIATGPLPEVPEVLR